MQATKPQVRQDKSENKSHRAFQPVVAGKNSKAQSPTITSPRMTSLQQEEGEEPEQDFKKKNHDNLRAMQEKRAAEQKMIEEQRAKAERRQKKLQDIILAEA